MNRMHVRSTLVALAALCSLAVAQTEKTTIDPASYAPGDALVFVGVTDAQETWEAIQKTAAYKIMQDPAMKDVNPGMQLIEPMIEQFRGRLSSLLGTTPDQLKSPFAGPIAMWLAAPQGGDPNSVTLGVVAGVGDKALMRKYYDSAVAKLKETATYESASAGGATIDVFKVDPTKAAAATDEPDLDMPSGDPTEMVTDMMEELFSAESMPANMATALTDDLLVVAETPEAVRAIINREKGGKTLADTDDFKAIARHLKPVGQVQFIVNLPRLFELGRASSTGADADEFAKVMRMMGAEGLRSAIGHLRFGAASYDSRLDVLFLMDGERSGLAKLLSMDNRAIAPPPSVNRETVFYAMVNVNPGQMVEEIERMTRQGDPATADAMRQSLEKFQMSPDAEPINLKTEVIDKLTGPLQFAVGVANPITPTSVRGVLSIGHRDQQAMMRFLGLFAGLLMPGPEVRGNPSFSISLAPTYGVVPTNDRLLLGSTASIDAALQSSGEALAETEMWRKCARFVPEEAWMVFFTDNKRMMQVALEFASKPEEVNAAQEMGAMFFLGMAQGIPKDKLDAAKKMLDYSAPQIVTISTRTEGVQFTAVSLKPGE